MGEKVIVFGEDGYPIISETLCIGCGICVKKCPFSAIHIVNLASEVGQFKVHQYGPNTFRLYRLPVPKKGSVVGLVGRNGVGKSTAINILSGNIRPNLGRFEEAPGWDEILKAFRGTELFSHFQAIAEGRLKASVKPQAIYLIPRYWDQTVRELLDRFDERGIAKGLAKGLALINSLDKRPSELSGGELQRLAVAIAASREADIYLFDEPSSYNDVLQRLSVSKVVRELALLGKAVILVEHDLTFLDYSCDFVHIIYGDPGVFGVVSRLLTGSAGINSLLDGIVPGENVRFRETPVTFEVYSPIEEASGTPILVEYPELDKSYPGFSLHIRPGNLKEGQVIGVLGANALGKTTFLKMLAGVEKPDSGEVKLKAKVSYKPQYLSSDFEGTVQELLDGTLGEEWASGQNMAQLIKPLGIDRLLEKQVSSLSGGELQKVAVAVSLLRKADLYALDEPSAFTDVEDRIAMAKAIQRYIKGMGKSAMIIDHDVMLIDIVSDSLIIFTGEPGRKGEASEPLGKEEGMNLFLKNLGITYRRDLNTGRPRVNKPGSRLDRKQKMKGQYYYLSRAE
jgi:ATP-binding cassette subfamily E protein 1